MLSIGEYKGFTFRKQLAYKNRTFLIGNYEYSTGACTFRVVKNGKVFDFDTLEEAIKKFNEISGDKE